MADVPHVFGESLFFWNDRVGVDSDEHDQPICLYLDRSKVPMFLEGDVEFLGRNLNISAEIAKHRLQLLIQVS